MGLDLDAAIVPGQSAAGLELGSRIANILAGMGRLFTPDPIAHPCFRSVITRYRSEHVDLWEEDGIINQIGVHGAYRGKPMDKISLGSTIEEIEALVGKCEEDDEDYLAIKGLPGLCFDAEGDFPPAPNGVDFSHPAVRNAPVTAFYVFMVGRTRELPITDRP